MIFPLEVLVAQQRGVSGVEQVDAQHLSPGAAVTARTALCAEELPERLALRPDSPAQDLGDHGDSSLHGWAHPCCPDQLVHPVPDRHGHRWHRIWDGLRLTQHSAPPGSD